MQPPRLHPKLRKQETLPSYGMPKAIWWTMEPWTIENGLLTPTLKVKRAALEKRFGKEIEAMYAGAKRAA